MKYQKLYKAISSISYEEYKDCKNNVHDFWVILESKKHNKRIWITHDFCKRWNIATAQLDTPCNSQKYNESWQHYTFNNLTETTNYIINNF